MSELTHTVEGAVLTLDRVFKAPAQKVWDAFTKQELFIQWWGPKGWTTVTKEFDFSEGGVNHYGMRCDDPEQKEWYGKYSWGKMVYSNIEPIDSFDYVDYFVDEDAVIQEGMPASTTTIRFIQEGDATRVITVTDFETEEALKTVIDMGMIEGITQTWDRLGEMVEQG